VHLSTHYLVLSLSERNNSLYECFRDTVIDIRNEGFPVVPSAADRRRADDGDPLRDLMCTVDRRFGEHYKKEPLGVVVIGESAMQSVFASVTEHEDAIIGRVDGDFTTTSPHDVGRVVWPVVKEAMSGIENEVTRNLEDAKNAERLICGIDSVGHWAGVVVGSTLVVEEEYRVRGTIRKVDNTTMILPDVDLREPIDDVVDTIIESVLRLGGHVVFTKTGALHEQQRIALILSQEGKLQT
jgi:hypothetical protein